MVGHLTFHNNILTELEKFVKTLQHLQYFSKNWYEYTKDKCILDVITNSLQLDLKELPTQNIRPTYPLSSEENEITLIEIIKSLKKLVIVCCTPDEGEFISGIFTRDKKDGNKSMILNLNKFNKFVN